MKNLLKYILFTLTILFCATNINAQELIAEADSAYVNDDYSKAIELYSKAIDEYGTSSLLYYNLANAYYRSGQIGKSIVCYERAIILDPQNLDAKTNLEFVNTKISDKPGDNGTFISNTVDLIVSKYHSNTWATIAITLFFILIIAISLYIFTKKILLKKVGFFGAIILLIAMVISIIFSVQSANIASSHNKAIIISPSVILSTSPRIPKDRTEEAMLLHEGTKVEILDSVSEGGNINTKWYDVKIDNSHRAWINSSAVEII